MWRTLVFGGLSLVWLFSCSSSSKNTDTVCNPKMTQACNKTGCVGVQECRADGVDWGPCECSGTGGNSTGGTASGGTSSGGTSSGGTSSGGTSSGGSAGSATGGVAGVAGVAGSGSGGATSACLGFSQCVDRYQCCENENPAGKLNLKNSFVTNCDTLSPQTSLCSQACNATDGGVSTEMTVLAACLQSLTNGGLKDSVLFDCGCADFVTCLGPCI